jgi:hypothetical protein
MGASGKIISTASKMMENTTTSTFNTFTSTMSMKSKLEIFHGLNRACKKLRKVTTITREHKARIMTRWLMRNSMWCGASRTAVVAFMDAEAT